MMGISSLYSNGQGVAQDGALAREWSEKAHACHAKQMDALWEQSAKLRTMADPKRLAPGPKPVEVPPGGYRLPTDDKFLAIMGSLVAASVAYAELHPEEQGSGDVDLPKRWRQDDLDRRNWQKLVRSHAEVLGDNGSAVRVHFGRESTHSSPAATSAGSGWTAL